MLKKWGRIEGVLNIRGVRDNCITLSNGDKRWIYKVEPINYDLLSIQNQEVLVKKWARVLNSLDCPIQFLMVSSKASFDDYKDFLCIKEENIDYIKQLEEYIFQSCLIKQEFFIIISDNERFLNIFPLIESTGFIIYSLNEEDITNLLIHLLRYG